ncbi:MAG TPA: electron transfer flavoprotein beta subunit/FixA family protein [Anaerolineales bacterium]|nr:electron transfer flavoprotein beta subunit/FixA family protein [Anaerolineae bacterium]HIQ01564.1 electron transfer flavoprotein beta subunit/FixA family protein [Anaerolineales bacterium]
MHIVVCIKQTPDSAAKLTVDEAGNVSWGESPIIINPWDEYAVEEALLIKERFGGEPKVTVVSMGPEEALEALKHAIAMGCDEAVRIWDDGFAGSDTLATSYVLAKAIERMGDVDLVLFGKSAIDSQTGQVAVEVARRLGFAPLTYVIKIAELDPEGGAILVERLLEEGRQGVEAPLPAVVGTVKGINEPRYPSFMGIRKATRAEYPVWTAADLGVGPDKVGAAGSGVRWERIFPPPAREGAAEIIQAETVEEAARVLVDKLLAEKVI